MHRTLQALPLAELARMQARRETFQSDETPLGRLGWRVSLGPEAVDAA